MRKFTDGQLVAVQEPDRVALYRLHPGRTRPGDRVEYVATFVHFEDAMIAALAVNARYGHADPDVPPAHTSYAFAWEIDALRGSGK